MAYDSNTKLLLHMDGADASTTFTDSETTPKTVTVNGSAQIDTAQSKFGGASGLLGPQANYLSLADSADFEFTGNFFVSYWYKSNARTNYVRPVSTMEYNSATFRGWWLGWGYTDPTNQPAQFASYNSSGVENFSITGSTDVNDGNWHYLEVSRSGSTVYLFLDGTSQGTASFSGTIIRGITTAGLMIGRLWTDLNQAGDYMNGWMDELIIVNGTAGNTANYTAPTAAWDNPAGATINSGTMLLLGV